MYVVDIVFYWAKTDPHRPAIIQPEIITSFKGLADAIDTISARIAGLNLDRSAPIAVSIANPVVFLSLLLALLRSGYSVAPVNRLLYPHLRGNGIKDLIFDTEGQVASGGRNIRFESSWLPSPGSLQQPQSALALPNDNTDVNIVYFTSGSTGLPKKFSVSYGALKETLAFQTTTADATREKALITAGITTSSFGLTRTLELLQHGKTVCTAPSPGAMLQLIEVFGIDCVVASAHQALALADFKKNHPEYELSALQTIMVGGGKIGPEGVKRIQAALCRNVITRYSSTETGNVAAAPYSLIANIPGAVGFVCPWAEVEIVNEADERMPIGMEGIIRIRTAKFTGSSAGNGGDQGNGNKQWFYPGDIGRLTPEGILCLSGRRSDVINRGGVKVSSTKIAEVLEGLPEIKEAAACAIEGRFGLEEIWIAVVPKGEISREAIKSVLSAHEEIRVQPDEVFFVDEIPRGDLGKVQNFRLKEMLLNLKSKA